MEVKVVKRMMVQLGRSTICNNLWEVYLLEKLNLDNGGTTVPVHTADSRQSRRVKGATRNMSQCGNSKFDAHAPRVIIREPAPAVPPKPQVTYAGRKEVYANFLWRSRSVSIFVH
ncbi:hypothetical protein ACH5RR_001127 [Cinchona calisaya]|uniref:Uncharacterized protein n=1 Tax=Cinchona calisaya TaxID=153742 RepID=A0ABD3B2Y1_9GENT